jgi:PhoH-like ATPase
MLPVSAPVTSKLFVLDTNVILHDSNCIENFEEHDIAIPITVLEELDQFKKGHENVHFHARAFLRRLDEFQGELLTTGGASLGPERGVVRVILGGELEPRLVRSLRQDSPDHRILNAALLLQQRERNRPVVLVSKDTNLRIKARSLGLPAEDYSSDKVECFDHLYAGKRTICDLPGDLIDALYGRAEGVPLSAFPHICQPVANENFILRNGSKSALATYRLPADAFVRIEKLTAYGIAPRNAEQSFALAALIYHDVRLVTLAGKAGTGKTLLALAAALHCRSEYRQILLARPVVPLSNRDLGFLPGDIGAKLEPYVQPLYDNLAVIRHQFDERDPNAQRIGEMLTNEKLLITPLAYIRGRSLHRAYLIVDEAQNLTPHEVKTIITRAGEGTKIVFTGDIQQIDHPYLDSRSNGLSYLISRMMGQSLYAHVTLEKGERSALADLASDRL